MSVLSSPDGIRSSRYIPIVLLAAITLAIFWPALKHDFLVNWDDQQYVTDNPSIMGLTPEHIKTAFTKSLSGNYAPLHLISYMVDYDIWGLKASGFIFTNILLHAINGILIYLLVIRMSGERIAAFFGSLLFLLHPVQVESVVWVSQRKTLLAMTFFLLAMFWYITYRRDKQGSPGRAKLFYGLSVAAFLFASLSKSVVVIYPLVILLYDICFDEPRKLGSLLVDKVPFAIISAFVANLAIGTHAAQTVGGLTTYHGGTLYTTLLTMLPVLARYLQLVLWPSNLSAFYNPPIKTSIDEGVVAASALCVFLIVIAILLYRRRQDLFFWFLLFFIGLIPVSQVVPLVTIMNDRYLYFPMLGIAVFVATMAFRGRAWSSLWASKDGIAVFAVSLIVVGAFTIVTSQRIGVWQNSATLWGDAVKKAPDVALTHDGYGEGLVAIGRVDEAMEQFKIALSMTPDSALKDLNTGQRDAYANTLNNLGITYGIKGRTDDAIEMFRAAIRLSPGLSKAYFNLGNALMHKGLTAEALKYFDTAVLMEPANPLFHANRDNTQLLLNAEQKQEKK